uniref:Amino acid adenylation domain-containing protein n=1 Tax=Micromonospora carbonacea TaxID=47853 RepID=A0A7D6GHE6_9ACTN|nr:amino acid adenylation domain-containing protein [Micromonospora carbonacea]
MTRWTDRLRSAVREAGPPLFRRRSKIYRRRSLQVELPLAVDSVDAGDTQQIRATWLATIAAVLFRYSGSAEPQTIVIGCVIDGTALPVAVPVGPDDSFDTVLGNASAALAETCAHTRSLDALTGELGLDGVTNRNPWFAVLLNAGTQAEAPADTRHDVSVTVTGAALRLEYNAVVQEEETVVRFGRHLLRFLATASRTAGAMRDIDYLGDGERQQIIDVWSGGPVSAADARALTDLVAEAVRRYPDAEAVVLDDSTLTYRELDARANRLAHYLTERGAGPGSCVGLCVAASVDLLVAVLAILKSGAAVVPVVATFPAARNKMVIEDAEMDLMVTQSTLGDLIPRPGPELIELDRAGAAIDRQPDTAPQVRVDGDDLAYVMFTSGSTGRPKGVAMTHRTLVNLVTWQRDRGEDPAGRRTMQRTSIGFDVSFQEIFSTLGFGGSLVVTPDDVRDDVSQLPGFIERHRIARAFLPPVSLDQLAVTANTAQFNLPTLREVIVAGEQLQISMPVRRLFHRLDCQLDNQYGPTETHVATAYRLEESSTRWPETPPIGRPIANVRIYLLDPWGSPVPAGVPGEIYIGGVAPARGYLHEEATAERFTEDPFLPHGRIYRTGDRGRFLADGTIEFLGRQDDQVKIRGYRIELGEVEANLLRIPGIRRAAATVHHSQGLGRQLVAHVITESEGEPTPSRIRQMLLERIPDHMVPATTAIVHTTSLPLTSTGKVDRRALPPPPEAALTAGGESALGETEEVIAQIWSAALGRPVARDDNFIDLGGHSLVGIQVVAQINERFSVTLPLRNLLRGTTVAAVAREVDGQRAARAVQPTGSTAPAVAEQPVTVPQLRTLTLPDNRTVLCLQPAESRYLYRDVFEHRTYDRGGIRYPDDGVIFDVGAHIGLFTRYALDRSPTSRVYAFEPCPPLFEALRGNTEKLPNVQIFPYGLGARADTAELTFYPNLTGMSSFHPDDAQERRLLSGILSNLSRLADEASGMLAGSGEYLDERLRATTFTVSRRTLSQALAETGVEHVDLLKIDVQKAELEVLDGIAAADWDRIGQIVVEAHDLDNRVASIAALLTGHGYRVTTEQDPLHAGTPVHFLYAVRP